MHQLFDTEHLLFSAIMIPLAIFIAILIIKKVKTESAKLKMIKGLVILAFVLNFVFFYFEFFSSGGLLPSARSIVHIFIPLYPCNIAVYLSLFLLTPSKKQWWRRIALFVSVVNIVGGIIGILAYYYYAPNGFDDPRVLLSFITHFVLIILGIVSYNKHKFRSGIIASSFVVLGNLSFILYGLIINSIFVGAGLYNPNAMWLAGSPFPSLPWFTGYVMIGISVASTIIYGILHEFFFYKKEERFYKKN